MSKRRAKPGRKGRGMDTPASGRVSLSLCLIARNEAKHLAHCFESVRGVADEIVLVDTGSTDDTVAVAARYGARIFHFPWVDDFSAARNAAIAQARGEWILALDADEALSPDAQRRLRGLLADTRHMAFLLNIRSPLKDARGQSAVVNAWPRLFRNRPELRYEGRVHEQLSPSIARLGGMVARTDLVIEHRGYHQDFTDQKEKQARNLALLEKERAEHPDDPMMLFHLGEALGLGGRTQEAAEAYRAALGRPDMPPQNAAVAHRGLANCLLHLEDYAGVLAACDASVRLDPGYALPHLLAAMAQCRLQQPLEAIREIDEYLRVSAERRPAAERVLEHESAPGFALALKGDCLLGLGRRREAEAEFRRAIRAQPDAPEGHMGIGRIHALRGEFAEAARAFERAQALFRDLPRGHLALAEAYAAQGAWAQALPPVERFLSLEPRDGRALALRAEALLHAGRHDEAAAAYRHVLSVDPNPEAHLALACLADARGAGEEVLSQCGAARGLGGEDPRIFFLEGKYQMAAGCLAEAEESFGEARKRSPATPEIYQNLAAVALARGEQGQALEHFQALLALLPDHPVARRAVAVLAGSGV
jgi:tetratricopeptide (TPR) repeat protein